MGSRATVDGELCIGSLECNRIASQAFRINDDSGVSEPLSGVATTAPDVLVEAARGCPTQAISVFDDDDRVLYGES